MPGVHPGRLVDDHIIDVWIEPRDLRSHRTRQQCQFSRGQELFHCVDGGRGHQYVAKVIKANGQNPPDRVPGIIVHHASTPIVGTRGQLGGR